MILLSQVDRNFGRQICAKTRTEKVFSCYLPKFKLKQTVVLLRYIHIPYITLIDFNFVHNKAFGICQELLDTSGLTSV